MSQLIEGIDNEVTLTFTFITVAAAVVIPWYFLRPQRSQRENFYGRSGQPPETSREGNTGSSSEGNQRQPPETEPDQSRQPSSQDFPRDNANVSNVHRTSTPYQNVRPPPAGFRPEFLPHESPINPNTPQDSASSPANESINVRVKLISDSERPFQVTQKMLLKDFKSMIFWTDQIMQEMLKILPVLPKLCFPDEFGRDMLIRFIYSGRILQPDTETLQYFGIGDGCVVHAQISQRPEYTPSAQSTTLPEDMDLSSFLVPILTFALILGWLAIFTFDGIFTWTSILILAFLTIMMIVTSWL